MSAPSGTRRDAKAASPAATAATAESATSARTSRPGDALRRERALMGKLGARSAPWRDLSSATIVYGMRVAIEYFGVWKYEPPAAGLAARTPKTYPPRPVKVVHSLGRAGAAA